MEHLRTRVMPFTLLGLALVGTGTLLSGSRSAPARPPVIAEQVHTTRCTLEMPTLEAIPDDTLTMENEPDSAARMPTAEERALAVSTLTILQRALQRDDGAALAKIAHSTGMIFWSSHAELVPPAAAFTADVIDTPSVRLAESFFPTTYRRDVATKLRAALADLKSVASDDHRACGERAGAFLTANVIPDAAIVLDHPSFDDDGNLAARDVASPLRLRADGLDVFLGIESGSARVTHVVELDPCDTTEKRPEAPSTND